MFAEFDGTHHDFDSIVERSEPDDWPFAGDVKHHFGTSYVRPFLNGKSATVTPEANPLHLETVNTVALGRARAKQHYLGSTPETRKHVTPVLLHGDASFAGQSVFCEGMQLAHVQECFGVEGTPPRSSRTRTAALGTAADVGCARSSGKTGGVQLALPPSGGCFGALGVTGGSSVVRHLPVASTQRHRRLLGHWGGLLTSDARVPPEEPGGISMLRHPLVAALVPLGQPGGSYAVRHPLVATTQRHHRLRRLREGLRCRITSRNYGIGRVSCGPSQDAQWRRLLMAWRTWMLWMASQKKNFSACRLSWRMLLGV